MRGLGSTGASRTLVLWDGIPVNSPFGGWVYWTRIPPDDLERIELSQSPATSVFGDRAMGGAVAFFSRTPERSELTFGYSGGAHGENEIEAAGSYLFGKRWSVSANSRDFRSDGWYIVPDSIRGTVDRPAALAFAAGELRIAYLGDADRFALRFDALAEDRANGTALQKNSTGAGTLAGNWLHQWTSDTLSVLGWYTQENFHATFSSMNAKRTFEKLTSTQSVPASGEGGAAFWRHAMRHANLLAGGDWNRASGESDEVFYPGGLKVAGGSLTQGGGFAQGDLTWSRLRLFGGVRGEKTAGGDPFWSPSGGATLGLGRWRLRASGYRAFRAPTLNELYRNFRAGNVLTLANPALLPETLAGAEVGADWHAKNTLVSVTLYRNELGGLITNVTRSVTPQLITRQRDNAATAVARGVEARLTHSFGAVRFEGAWLLADSRVATGLRIPQVAKQQGSGQLLYQHKGTLLSAGVRASGMQFEDDLNAYRLPGYAVWHVAASQKLRAGFSLDLQVENLLDHTVIAG